MNRFRLSITNRGGDTFQGLAREASRLPGIRSAWDILTGAGGTEEALAAAVTSAGADDAPELFFLLELLDREGLLCRSVDEDGGPLLTLEPMTARFRFSPPHLSAEADLSLSRFACLRNVSGNLVIESGLSHARIILRTWRAAAVAAALVTPQTQPELVAALAGTVSEAAVRGSVILFAAAGILADKEDHGAVLRQWEFHDLLFHASTRRGRHDRPSGGTFRFAGEIEPLPAVRKVRGEVVELPEVTTAAGRDFFDVLRQRRSIRTESDSLLTLSQLADFLGHTARIGKVIDVDPQHGRAYQVALRPFPSGGACAELEIYPAVNRCDGLTRGLYRYDGAGHRLEVIAAPSPAFECLVREAGNTYGGDPQVLLIIAARFQRVSWKYESIAYSLILKDVGCLQQTMYLVATATGLAPCALGVGDADLFAEAAGLDYLREGSVGEFVLGGCRT